MAEAVAATSVVVDVSDAGAGKPVVTAETGREFLQRMKSEHPDGLSTAEAQQLLVQYGPNALPEKIVPLWRQVMKHAWGREAWRPDPIPVMLWFAMIISLILEDWPDFAVIFILYFVNASLAFHEERKAGNAVSALKSALAPTATVKRDGRFDGIQARDLVPGDIIKMKIGDVATADCVLLEGGECAMDQSSLTGESIPSSKKPGDTLYSGTTLKRGEVYAYVWKTGENTEFGKTASLIASVENQSRFLKILNGITNFILAVALLVNFALIAVDLERSQNILIVIQRALVLLVAAVPIATPLVCTATMAIGARKLAEENAVVTRLAAIEELSSMTILCSDKTGTLTLNKLQLDEPWLLPLDLSAPAAPKADTSSPEDNVAAPEELVRPGHVFSNNELIFVSALPTVSVDADAIDTAVRNCVVSNPKLGPEFAKYEQTEFIPFDPSNRRTTATIRAPNGTVFRVCKGAPKMVLAISKNANADAAIPILVKNKENEYAARGLRCLGVAIEYDVAEKTEGSEDAKNWVFLGLIAMFDPPRVDTASVVSRAHELGVAVKMITGDARPIAIETARRLGMGLNILPAEHLHVPNDTKEHVYDLCFNADGFAEVFPEDKFNIVAILQKDGLNTVAMTGDGVNDAPALKKANVGFAVKGATAAAQGAADVVLLNDGLSVIIAAIIRSRKVFERMKNYALYRINVSFSLLFFFFITIVFMNLSLPAIVVVLLALMLDAVVLGISKDFVRPDDIRKPCFWDLPVVLSVSVAMGLLSAALSVLVLIIFRQKYILPYSYTDLEVMSIAFLQIALLNEMDVFIARCRYAFFTKRPGKALTAGSFVGMIVVTLLGVYWPFGSGMEPAGWAAAGLVWALCIICCIILDLGKLLAYEIVFGARHYHEESLDDTKRSVRMRMSKLYTPSPMSADTVTKI
eukprot:ANDGO_02345.mRNA.1 ATPase 3